MLQSTRNCVKGSGMAQGIPARGRLPCLCFDTENEAAQAYAKLSEALAVFELKVNIQKTKIVRASDFQYDS
jgi:hypothetical protein